MTPIPVPTSLDPAQEEKEQEQKDAAEQCSRDTENKEGTKVPEAPEEKNEKMDDVTTGAEAKSLGTKTDVSMEDTAQETAPGSSGDQAMSSPGPKPTKRLFPETLGTSPTRERTNPKTVKTEEGNTTGEMVAIVEYDLYLYEYESQDAESGETRKSAESLEELMHRIYGGRTFYATKSGEKLDKQKVMKGRLTEIGQVRNFEAVEDVPIAQSKGKKHVRMKWLDDEKIFDEGEEIVRSRLVCQEIAHGVRFDVFAAALGIKAVRIVISLCASKEGKRSRQLGRYDMKVAFFHADQDEEIYCTPPVEAQVEEGMCWRLRKAFYGTRRVSVLWQKKYTDVFLANGFVQCTAVTVIFFSESWDVTVCVHGDDFLAEGKPSSLNKLDEMMRANFTVKVLRRVGPGASSKGNFLNRSIEWSEKGFTLEADEKHARILIEALGMEDAKGVDSPGSKATGKNLRDAEDELTPEWAAWYRSLAGRELYLAQDRYDLQQAASTLRS